VKLHKVLWFTDVKAYQSTGETLTGGTFIKQQYGPFLRELEEAVQVLEKAGRLTLRRSEVANGIEQCQYTGKGEPEKHVLSDREMRWLDEYIKDVTENHTAGSISERTHNRTWEMAQMYEPIPVGAAAIRFVKPGPESQVWAVQELDRIGV